MTEKKVKKTKTVTKPEGVPPEELTRLRALSKSSGSTMEEIFALYTESLNELMEKGVKANVERLAVNGVKNRLRKDIRRQEYVPKVKAVAITGFIIGDMGMRDKAEEMRQKAKRYIDKNSVQAAEEMHLINGDNQILDQRQKIYGRDNPDYLDPLKEGLKLRSRTLWLISRKNGDKKFKYGTIHTEDNGLALGWGKVKFFRPCQTFGILKEETEGEFKFNSSQAEETVSVFKAIQDPIDVNKVFMEVIEPQITAISEVEKHHESFKDAWDRRIFVRGVVAWINRDRPTPWGSVWMGLMDPNADMDKASEVRISVPQHLTIDCGEQSEVIILGRTRRAKNKDPDSDDYVDADVIIDAVGIYPIPGLTTPSEFDRPEVLADEKEIEGWLE